MRDFEMVARKRFVDEQAKIAQRLRELADEVDRVPTTDHRGDFVQPTAIIERITHTIMWGVANLRLDLMSTWATDVYEAAYDKSGEARRCFYVIEEDGTETHRCVLDKGHQGPIDEGMIVHVDASGCQFL